MASGESASRLIEDNLDLAQKAARIVWPRVREYVELEELVSLASVGLAEAAARYDADAGVPFRSFAWYRVHGAVMDGLRRATNLPRRVWARLVALRAASEYLEAQGQRAAASRAKGSSAPTNAEALAQIKDSLSAIRTMYVTSLSPILEAEQDPVAPDERADDRLHRSRMAAKVAAAIAQLPAKERTLVTKHYYEGKNLLEAGLELGISKSWASRLHAQAVDRMRGFLELDEPDD
ncbi:MAG TPA: sigma-70 family RNA polymerase sigma factor [Kofleriaceae bacterium]|nr:sigma-70 family RNA polymerase sigma factor [Kofleriaceae bacterium]